MLVQPEVPEVRELPGQRVVQGQPELLVVLVQPEVREVRDQPEQRVVQVQPEARVQRGLRELQVSPE